MKNALVVSPAATVDAPAAMPPSDSRPRGEAGPRSARAPHVVVLAALLAVGMTGAGADADGNDSAKRSKSQVSCTCPKEGEWKVQNHEGWMNCTGPADIKRTLKEVKDKGTIWIIEPDCSTIFAEASKEKNEDVLMERVAECRYEGKINGEENGVQMAIDVEWTVEGDTLIKGEMHSKPSLQGMMCEYYRPFEIRFDEPMSASEYPKRKKKMKKKLDEARGN